MASLVSLDVLVLIGYLIKSFIPDSQEASDVVNRETMRYKQGVMLIALQVLQVGAYVETESIHAALFGGAVCDFSKIGKEGDCSYQEKKESRSSYNK